ncbi:hypothetical protein KC332_g1328 [Hortaea werneckii]|nr:hypothetical protein KC335_g4464 [Hortaea werneckii]KAI7419623.1 hypothetical protein KC332_g1328 [Hortaea werneckii]KAI7445491.1 hypothetical protein KC368_g7657 [Hortaea werneckii]
MSYPPPPYGPPAGQQQPPMYNYNPNQPPMYQQQNPNMMYQHHQPMLGHWQAPQYAYSQPPTINIYYIGYGGAPQYSHSLPPNTTFSFSFGNAPLLNMLRPRIRFTVRSSTSNLLRRRIHSRCIRTCRPKRLLRTMVRFIRLNQCLSNQVMLSTQGHRLLLHVLIVRLCRIMAEHSLRETQILRVWVSTSWQMRLVGTCL